MRLPPKLEGMITHGMWSSAATRKHVVAQGKPECVIAWVNIIDFLLGMAVDTTLFMIDRYDVTFVGMVPPRRIERQAHSHRVAKRQHGHQGRDYEPARREDNTAEVAHPPTVYVFIGQGSQERGMGMCCLGCCG